MRTYAKSVIVNGKVYVIYLDEYLYHVDGNSFHSVKEAEAYLEKKYGRMDANLWNINGIGILD